MPFPNIILLLLKICAAPQLDSFMPWRVAPCNTLCMQIHQMLSTVTAYDTSAISQVAFINQITAIVYN